MGNLLTIHPGDVRRLAGSLTEKEIKKLPKGINVLQSASQLSRTKVLELEKIIPGAAVVAEKDKIFRFDRLNLKAIKKASKPADEKIIKKLKSKFEGAY